MDEIIYRVYKGSLYPSSGSPGQYIADLLSGNIRYVESLHHCVDKATLEDLAEKMAKDVFWYHRDTREPKNVNFAFDFPYTFRVLPSGRIERPESLSKEEEDNFKNRFKDAYNKQREELEQMHHERNQEQERRIQ